MVSLVQGCQGLLVTGNLITLASQLHLQPSDLLLGSRQVTGCPAQLLLQLVCPICSHLQITQSFEQCPIA